MAKFSLSKAQRLSGKKNIETLFQNGEAFFIHPYRILHQLVPANASLPYVRLAIVAPKKNFKRAVDRNHIKRKIKEAYRLNQFTLDTSKLQEANTCLHLMIHYAVKNNLPYAEMELQMQKVLQKCSNLVNTK